MNGYATKPVALRPSEYQPQASGHPLVVLLHGRGADKSSMAPLTKHVPEAWDWVVPRGPIDLGGSFTWFENRGIGRPDPASLERSIRWFRSWLDDQADGRDVVLVGFSGGAAFASAVALDDPAAISAMALLHGVAAGEHVPGRLGGMPVFLARSTNDQVLPTDLARAGRDYLVDEPGADLTEVVTDTGHTIDADTARTLGAWLAGRSER